MSHNDEDLFTASSKPTDAKVADALLQVGVCEGTLKVLFMCMELPLTRILSSSVTVVLMRMLLLAIVVASEVPPI